MFKKVAVVCTLICCVFPMLAMAASWSLNTWVKTSNGNIVVRGGTPQTNLNGSVLKNYTTSTPIPIQINPNTGYNISSVVLNGVTTSYPNTQNFYSVLGPPNQTFYVSFAAKLLSITASAGYGGSVTPTNFTSIYYGQKPATALKFTFTPISGYNVANITGVPVGATVSSPLPAPANTAVSVTFPTTFTFTSDIAVYGTFSGPPVAAIGPPKTLRPGQTGTLDGSPSTGSITSYSWSQTSGPNFPTTRVIADNTQGMQVNFVPPVAGSYNFKLTVTGGSWATTTVPVTDDPAATERTQCQNCHDGNSVGTSTNVFPNWSSSKHNPNIVMCANCHVGADTGSHPGPPLTSPTLLNACNSCHIDGTGNVPGHPFDRGSNICVDCHNPHSTIGVVQNTPAIHFNNVTTGAYPASYATSRSTCMDCHYNSTANSTIRKQWELTGHAATTGVWWTSNDFKTMSGCVQCHSTTGFIAYSTGKATAAWGSASDKTKEVLSCIGCHSDIVAGTVRSVSPVKPFADDPYQNRNVGESNLCFDCHSGTNNGTSISGKVGSADFGNLPFIAPHFKAAGGNLHGAAGYRFSGQSYQFYSSNSHRLIGLGNKANTGSAGPCVACHMTSYEKHSYKPVVKDVDGNITGISTPVCANCHSTSLDAGKLNSQQADFQNALNVLKAALQAKDPGFVYTGSAPYFANTNWGSGQAGADTMGAAYNYMLLLSDPGAYAHNPAYARKLISDSIDLLYNGRVTGSVTNAVTSLVNSGAITQQAADQFTNYKSGATACISCHDARNTGSHAKHNLDVPCADCHNATALNGSTLLPGTATHLNGQVDVLIAPIDNKTGGINYTKSSGSCSAVTCHGNGTQVTTWGGSVTCESCHTGTLSVIDGVTAQDRSLSATRGHGMTPGIGYRCTDCHDSAKQHLGGTGMLKDQYTGMQNNECNVCHNDSVLIPDPAFNLMRTHISKSGGLSDCTDCHDPHGTSNFAMIRTTILGQPITFTNEDQLIDPVTNMGFCQVCHTKTKYFQAGIQETIHDQSQCLACHDHKAPNGGFLNRPIKQCNSCHGYPPAPRKTPLPVRFGVLNNWSAAKFERYSGGGGAHLVPAHVPKDASLEGGWTNCIMCHDPNFHRVDLTLDNPPVTISHVSVYPQLQYRFSNGFTLYTGARLVDPPARNRTGSCFNLSCHMSPTVPWSTER